MFIGHFALGFAAKRQAPRVSLAVLFAAAQLADLLWPVLVAAGVEEVRIDPGNTVFTPLDFVSYPYSHSLLTLGIWGAVLAWGHRMIAGNGRAFLLIPILVVSHWGLDAVTHRPDLPLYPGGPKYGLGLWNSFGWTLATELVLFVAGVCIYLRATRPRDATGRWAFVSLTAFLLIVYAANAAAPPPPSVPLVYWSAIAAGILLTVWAWWADSHRQSTAIW
jgi:hypothetical protein